MELCRWERLGEDVSQHAVGLDISLGKQTNLSAPSHAAAAQAPGAAPVLAGLRPSGHLSPSGLMTTPSPIGPQPGLSTSLPNPTGPQRGFLLPAPANSGKRRANPSEGSSSILKRTASSDDASMQFTMDVDEPSSSSSMLPPHNTQSGPPTIMPKLEVPPGRARTHSGSSRRASGEASDSTAPKKPRRSGTCAWALSNSPLGPPSWPVHRLAWRPRWQGGDTQEREGRQAATQVYTAARRLASCRPTRSSDPTRRAVQVTRRRNRPPSRHLSRLHGRAPTRPLPSSGRSRSRRRRV